MSKNSPSVAAIDMSKFIQPNPGACCVYLWVRWMGEGLELGRVRVQPYKHSPTFTQLLLIAVHMHEQFKGTEHELYCLKQSALATVCLSSTYEHKL